MTWNYSHHQSTFNIATNSNHQRASSNSSVGSAGPATPYNRHTSPLVSTGHEYYDGLPNSEQASYSIFQKPLPTPTHTPLRDLFSSNEYQSYPQTIESDHSTIMTLQHKALEQQQAKHEDSTAQAEYPQRPSISSRNESSEDFHGRRKAGECFVYSHPLLIPPYYDHQHHIVQEVETNSYMSDYQGQVPKLDRTISDVFADELYSPNFSVTSAPEPPSTEVSSPSHAQSLIAQRLQAANSQHLSAPQQFPMANIPRDRSPFRQGSPLDPSPSSFQLSPLSAAKVRKQEKAENDAKMLEEQMRKHSPGQDTQQTISPKDALLEYHESEEDANMPLFAPQKSPRYRTPKVEPNQADETESLQSFGSMATSRRESSSAYSASSQNTAQPSSGFNFAPPSVSGQAQMPQVPQQYPFVAHQNSQNKNHSNNAENSPEFHSTLPSMESSGSDYVPEIEQRKPANVSADGGTYTCTYQGCTLRFDTPAKLQKHKKDGHRQAGSTTIVGGSSTRGASEGATARNSQAGPHRCDRINPSTGKPCSTVFSRPYDLTRHEDTIHNARHQKIRCSLCTEVKTFSRNDALTRHFRVVHPEVELPGKTRRRHID